MCVCVRQKKGSRYFLFLPFLSHEEEVVARVESMPERRHEIGGQEAVACSGREGGRGWVGRRDQSCPPRNREKDTI